ncbi:Uncharacterized protein TCM_012861 [Theobroma cacao]|uniref:Uncharacterized protein n=1 Tax=Theobroma cacao TaxID=3641 RepID=A0A061FUZ0_THECC|nr:Uncharacterized protein TCM_012861 [Theobroma cacao]
MKRGRYGLDGTIPGTSLDGTTWCHPFFLVSNISILPIAIEKAWSLPYGSYLNGYYASGVTTAPPNK